MAGFLIIKCQWLKQSTEHNSRNSYTKNFKIIENQLYKMIAADYMGTDPKSLINIKNDFQINISISPNNKKPFANRKLLIWRQVSCHYRWNNSSRDTRKEDSIISKHESNIFCLMLLKKYKERKI